MVVRGGDGSFWCGDLALRNYGGDVAYSLVGEVAVRVERGEARCEFDWVRNSRFNNTHLATFNGYVLVYVLLFYERNWNAHSCGDGAASCEWSGGCSRGLGTSNWIIVESIHCVLLMIVLDQFNHVNHATRT